MGTKPIKKLPAVPEVAKQDEIKVEVPIPDAQEGKPAGIITTKRETPIKRYNATPLRETHGMTTESNRFKEG
jgi:hypothetical protein